MEVKRSKLSLVALILGLIACLIMYSSFSGSNAGNAAEALGEGIGKTIVLPAVIMASIGFVLNTIGFITKNRTLTLISAIFYTLSIVVMPLWGFVCIPSAILQFIAFAKMPKKPND